MTSGPGSTRSPAFTPVASGAAGLLVTTLALLGAKMAESHPDASTGSAFASAGGVLAGSLATLVFVVAAGSVFAAGGGVDPALPVIGGGFGTTFCAVFTGACSVAGGASCSLTGIGGGGLAAVRTGVFSLLGGVR